MNSENDNMLAIAELTGKLDGQLLAIRGENEAMESRIDASLSDLRSGVDVNFAKMREDMAKRETRLLLAIAGMIGLAVAILGLAVAILGLWLS
ncbi:MAG: hypothetical protein OXC91_14780 [Rhodobacteraceae bacterium]|nr:hypothetical protein [Paracoccaceae bacterium]